MNELFKVIWERPKCRAYIALTDYGLQLCTDYYSDCVILYGDGTWACDTPYAWPKYIKNAMGRIAKKFKNESELYKAYNL